MKFLVIVQDLRISGTSEGVVSRSFLGKLRNAYPNSIIDVVYLKHHNNDDKLDLLPVDSVNQFYINQKIPWLTLQLNKINWRLFHKSLKSKYILNKYNKIIKDIKFEVYNHVFIRSSGQDYETILGCSGLPILKNAIINFHDPYPVLWDTGSKYKLTKFELYKLIEMWNVVQQAKGCISPAKLLSEDMEHLYGSNKSFYTLPHQYTESVFDFTSTNKIRKKNKKITISYHGAVQFTRNIDVLLDAYVDLIDNNNFYKTNTEVVLRLRGSHTERLKSKYSNFFNIIILDTLDFCNSSKEQATETDILIILENCSTHSNILVGKASFLASLNKPVLSISPLRSEMRNIIIDNQYIANCNNYEEVKQKLENLIINRLNSNELVYPFGDYFSNEIFKGMLDKFLV